jgi:Uma2 family endonuclease
MSSGYKIQPHYTYEEYSRWEGQWEIIEGISYNMSSRLQPGHQAVAGNLHAEFRAALKAAGCSCTVYQPIDYKVAEDTVLNPDLLIVCQPIIKAFLDFAPELVVEILSSATALKDRHTKFEIYRQQQIPYYLMVDVDARTVEVYQLDDKKQYRQQELDLQKPFPFSFSGCSCSLVFEAIWS